MPQGRRKLPFSGKKKKVQILAKRQSKTAKYGGRQSNDSDEGGDTTSTGDNMQKINNQPAGKLKSSINRYNLHFHKESKKELILMKQEARSSFRVVSPVDQEVGSQYFDNFDFPIRPPWSYGMSKEELNMNENRYFREYVQKMEKLHHDNNKVISLFELNLETWRQLWRVIELSDILVIIVDVRYSALIFPPSLYIYVKEELKKNVILVLNKIDLVPPEVVVAWKNYFSEKYKELSVLIFASYPFQKVNEDCKTKKKRINTQIAARGALSIFKECKKIVGSDLNLTAWEQKITEDISAMENRDDRDSEGNDYEEQEEVHTHTENYDFEFETREKYKNGILTIGCIGFPNVGKSSLINALKGRKVVSVSRTPGHTKHFQTIFLTENVKLCDCPGLVFPSTTPKFLQVLLGSYPIAQLREPYCSIRFLGERVDLASLLHLQLPEDFTEWSAIAICEAWALKRGFLTAKTARPDHYRAANNILRMALEGRIVLKFYPPNFFASEDHWKNHPDLEPIKKLQSVERKMNVLEEAKHEGSSTEPQSTESTTDDEESDESVESLDGGKRPNVRTNFELLQADE